MRLVVHLEFILVQPYTTESLDTRFIFCDGSLLSLTGIFQFLTICNL
jgi:hypothetical protein